MEEMADIQVAIELGYHIDNPCVDYKTGKNIRYFYINLAKEAVKTFTNPYAKEYLESKIKEYKQNID